MQHGGIGDRPSARLCSIFCITLWREKKLTIYWTRTDSNSANNPALNSTGDPPIQIEFVTSGTNGDLILEQPAPGAIDPDTQVMIDGVAYDFTFELTGTMPTTNNNGANQVPEQYQGSAVNVITVYDYPSPGDTTRLYFFPEETATEAEMDSIGNGAIDIQNLDTTPPESPVCFASGTLIATPKGPVPVEDLRPGDLVSTIDSGDQPVIWRDTSHHDWPGSAETARPVCIRRGALGPDMPMRDLIVSPQHKIVLRPATAGRGASTGQCIAPARGLTGLQGIRVMEGKRQVDYHHILLPRHAALLSDGLATESFFPGPTARKMLSGAALRALDRALSKHGLTAATYKPAAWPALTVRAARALVRTTAVTGVRGKVATPATLGHAIA